MKNYGKVLEAFYFEILGQQNEILREAEAGKIMAFVGDAPGGFGMWQFSDVEYVPNQGESNGTHTWKCQMKNFMNKKFVGLVWRDKEELYNTSVLSNGRGRDVYLTAEPQKDGSHKWLISFGAHALVRSGNNVLASTADRTYRWTMRLRNLHLDYNLDDLKYFEKEAESLKTKRVEFMVDGEIQTGEGITVTTEQSASFTRETVLEYGFNQTLAIGATIGAKVKAPGGIVEASAELRVDASVEATQKNTVSTSVTYFTKDTITVGENKDVKITAWVDWVENGKVPFLASFDIRGTAAKADGDSEADTMNTEEIVLVLQEKGFNGELLEPKSESTASANIKGTMKGSFGFKKHISVL